MKINDIVNEQQLNEFGWSDIQKGAQKVTKGAQKFTKNVNKTGDAVAGAANAIGGAGKALGNQLVARPVGAAYNAVKGGLSGATNVAKKVGTDVAAGVGNVAKGAGAVAGGATTGVARAAAKGFNAGADAVGGEPADKLGSVFKQNPTTQQQATGTADAVAGPGAGAEVASIENQINQHKSAISDLQSQLAQTRGAQSQATTKQNTDNTDTEAGNVIGDLAKGAADAINRGAFASIGQSVADKGKDTNKLTIKDRYGKPTQYKKLGNQWVGADNKPVEPALASLLDKQAQAQATPTSSDYVGRRQVARNQQPVTPATATVPTTTQPTVTSKNATTPDTATAPTTPATTTATTTPNYGQRSGSYKTNYATPTYNAPTGVPNVTDTNPPVTSKNGATTVTPAPSNQDATKAALQKRREQGLMNAGKINKKPALEESSIDFSALLWDQIK